MKHWTLRSNERNLLRKDFLKNAFPTFKSYIIIKSFSFNSATPDNEFIIYFFYGIINLLLSITTNFLELKCRFYQPVLDYKHLMHELQTLLRKEQAEHIFTGLINNFRCPCRNSDTVLTHQFSLLNAFSHQKSVTPHYFVLPQ